MQLTERFSLIIFIKKSGWKIGFVGARLGGNNVSLLGLGTCLCKSKWHSRIGCAQLALNNFLAELYSTGDLRRWMLVGSMRTRYTLCKILSHHDEYNSSNIINISCIHIALLGGLALYLSHYLQRAPGIVWLRYSFTAHATVRDDLPVTSDCCPSSGRIHTLKWYKEIRKLRNTHPNSTLHPKLNSELLIKYTFHSRI